MTGNSQLVKENNSNLSIVTGWFFSILFISIGIINTFWGNDMEYGMLIILLSFVFTPPVNVLIKEKLGFAIPWLLKIVLGLLIILSALGVGELFGKIELMLRDF
jgi:hypothetical membrane protein